MTKNDRYSREFVLKLVYIYGPHIKDTKPMVKSTWDDLVDQAHKNRLNVDDVKKEIWEDVKIPITWW